MSRVATEVLEKLRTTVRLSTIVRVWWTVVLLRRQRRFAERHRSLKLLNSSFLIWKHVTRTEKAGPLEFVQRLSMWPPRASSAARRIVTMFVVGCALSASSSLTPWLRFILREWRDVAAAVGCSCLFFVNECFPNISVLVALTDGCMALR
jgi:hypothetical protein